MKKKTFVLLLAVAVITSLAIGATLAYFSAKDAKTNTFTVGNVQIRLDEPAWKASGALDAPEVYPGEPLAKDPRVTNIGDNPCVVRIKVTMPALPAGQGEVKIRTNGVIDAYDSANWYKDGDYYYYLKPLKGTADGGNNPHLSDVTTALFDHIVMPKELKNDLALTPYNVVVTAEAVQAQGIFPSWSKISDGIDPATELAAVKTMFTNAF